MIYANDVVPRWVNLHYVDFCLDFYVLSIPVMVVSLNVGCFFLLVFKSCFGFAGLDMSQMEMGHCWPFGCGSQDIALNNDQSFLQT